MTKAENGHAQEPQDKCKTPQPPAVEERETKATNPGTPLLDRFQFIDNDTVAVMGLIMVALISLALGGETIASAAIGAIGGYIGSKGGK